MVKGKPYVHWKIKDETDLTDVDPTYLWGTVVETDKGPIDEPVIIKSVEQGKRIFNYDFSPFFANGGRYIVVVRAYGQDSNNMPEQAKFSIVNDKDIEYLTVEYVMYEKENEEGKIVTVNSKSQGIIYIKEDTLDSDEPIAASALEDMPEGYVEQYVAFSAGRWRITDSNKYSNYYGKAVHYYYADITKTGKDSVIDADVYKEVYKKLDIKRLALEKANKELSDKESELGTTYNDAKAAYNSASDAYDAAVTAYNNASEEDKPAAQADVEAALATKTAAYEPFSVLDSINTKIINTEADISELEAEAGKYKVLQAECWPDADDQDHYYYAGTEEINANPVNELEFTFTKAFNQSLVKQLKHTVRGVIEKGEELINLKTKYPGDFEIPIAVNLDKRGVGYRISIQESNDYTLLLSGANTPKYITNRINERAENIVATTTKAGETLNSLLLGNLQHPPRDAETGEYYPFIDESETPIVDNSALYDEIAMTLPVGSVFAPISEDKIDLETFEMRLSEIQDYFSEGSNGPWDVKSFRIPSRKRVAAHENALSYLSNVKLAGIFCLYGENNVQQVYVDHVSTTEPSGMNSEEVCKWRQLIIGANAYDRTPDSGMRIEERALPLYDKAIAADNQYIVYLGQGLIDDGYIPETRASEFSEDADLIATKANFEGGKDYQLLPYQCVQYIAGLRSSLFYGASIFGGQEIKKIRGVGNMEIAPLFSDEDKVLWQPDTYTLLNEFGVLTFTNEYGQISLTDGVTTRQDPLQEDEEGVVSIVKYAQHQVHEILLKYIGRNITGDLQTGMEVEVRNVLNNMYGTDKTLIDLPEEGYSAFDVQIVLAPKSNTQQLLSKVYVYLKLTPVHALRQIEVELTVQ